MYVLLLYTDADCTDSNQVSIIKRQLSTCNDEDDLPTIALSQPTIATIAVDELKSLLQKPAESKPICFSQPTHNDDLLLGSQLQSTQTCITSVSLIL